MHISIFIISQTIQWTLDTNPIYLPLAFCTNFNMYFNSMYIWNPIKHFHFFIQPVFIYIYQHIYPSIPLLFSPSCISMPLSEIDQSGIMGWGRKTMEMKCPSFPWYKGRIHTISMTSLLMSTLITWLEVMFVRFLNYKITLFLSPGVAKHSPHSRGERL